MSPKYVIELTIPSHHTSAPSQSNSRPREVSPVCPAASNSFNTHRRSSPPRGPRGISPSPRKPFDTNTKAASASAYAARAQIHDRHDPPERGRNDASRETPSRAPADPYRSDRLGKYDDRDRSSQDRGRDERYDPPRPDSYDSPFLLLSIKH